MLFTVLWMKSDGTTELVQYRTLEKYQELYSEVFNCRAMDKDLQLYIATYQTVIIDGAPAWVLLNDLDAEARHEDTSNR